MSTDRDLPAGHEPLWTAKDVADYLRLSISWVYHRAASGDLPCRRVLGNLRFCPAEIRAYVRGTKPESAKVVSLVGRRSKWV